MTEQRQTRRLYSLSQYVRMAALLRTQAVASLDSTPVAVRHLFIGPAGADVDEKWLRLRLWFAYVFVAIEGWEQLCLKDDAVDLYLSDLRSGGDYDRLKRFRNAVFHYQDEPATEKLDDFLGWGPFDGAIKRAIRVQDALEAFTQRWRMSADLSGADSWQ